MLRSCLHSLAKVVKSPRQAVDSIAHCRDLGVAYRQVMSGVAASASIITTNHYSDLTRSKSEPRGLTVSSVSSLSVSPRPMVSFNLQVPSRTSTVLHDRGVFAINVLPASLESKQLCCAFAGSMGKDVNPFEKFRSFFNFQNSHWKDIDNIKDTTSIPTVKFANAVIYCKKHEVFRVQDHEIWVAEVYHVESVPDPSERRNSTSSLIYQGRSFHELGPKIVA